MEKQNYNINELEQIKNNQSEQIEENQSEQIEYCKVCGKPITKRFNFWDKKSRLVRCRCDCDEKAEQEKINKEQERKKKEQVTKLKNDCFSSKAMWSWNFDNDDGRNPKMEIAQKYVLKWETMMEQNYGLMFIGDVGSGKSYMAACIANSLTNQGYTVKMTNFIKIRNDIFSAADKNAYVEKLCDYDLLILDDIGTERNTDYSLENVYWVIDERTAAEKPIIITTNLNLDKCNFDENITYKRIYDRLRKVCIPIGMENRNLRQEDSIEHNSKGITELLVIDEGTNENKNSE